MTNEEFESIQKITEDIHALATPDNLSAFSTALTMVLGQAAVAGNMPPEILLRAVMASYARATVHPEDGANALQMLAFKQAAGWH